MSQGSVERVIGRLVTDEAFRHRFAAHPAGLLREVVESGLELNWCELEVLRGLDVAAIGRFAERLDPRIQKSDLGCAARGRGRDNLRVAGDGAPIARREIP